MKFQPPHPIDDERCQELIKVVGSDNMEQCPNKGTETVKGKLLCPYHAQK